MTRIADFVLGNKISQSEHCQVFLAHQQEQPQEQWLIKLIADLDPMDQVAVQVRSRILQRQPVPHCVIPRLVKLVDDKLMIARSSVPSLSLDLLLQDIKRNVSISLETALSPILDILSALAGLHQLSTEHGPMVHGRVFAAHVLIDAHGDALLLNAERGLDEPNKWKQSHDIAGCFALLYEILAVAKPKAMTSSQQQKHDLLQSSLTPIILRGLHFVREGQDNSALRLHADILELLHKLDFVPDKKSWAQWVENAGGAIPAHGPAPRVNTQSTWTAQAPIETSNSGESAPNMVVLGELGDSDAKATQPEMIKSQVQKIPPKIAPQVPSPSSPVLPGVPIQNSAPISIDQPKPYKNKRPNTTGVSGRLIDMPISEIVQNMELTRKTATVIVSNQAGWCGDISVLNGQVKYASSLKDQGEEAFFQLVLQKEGLFRIRYGEVKEPANIDNSTTYLLLEAMRRQDESNQ